MKKFALVTAALVSLSAPVWAAGNAGAENADCCAKKCAGKKDCSHDCCKSAGEAGCPHCGAEAKAGDEGCACSGCTAHADHGAGCCKHD